MSGETKKQTPAPSEQQPDRVGEALKILTADVVKTQDAVKGLTKHEELVLLADRLQPELANKRVNMTKEQLERLTFDARLQALELRRQVVEKIDLETQTQEEKTKDEQVWGEQLSSLEERYKILEQAASKPSRLPESAKPWAAQANAIFEPIFNKFKGSLASIGSFFGVTVPDKASDALAFMRPRGKKFMMAAMASTLGWIPGVADWARQQIDVEDAWNAIQLATKDVSSAVTLDDLKNDAKWLSLQTYLSPFPGRNIKEKTIQYVSLYISQQRKASPKAPILVSMNALLDAQLTPNFSVKPAPAAPAVVPVPAPAAGKTTA